MREVFSRLRCCRCPRLGVVALLGAFALLVLAGGTHLFEAPEKKAVRQWLAAPIRWRDETLLSLETLTNALPDASLPLLMAELRCSVCAFSAIARPLHAVLPRRWLGWLPDSRRAEKDRFYAILLGLRGREGRPEVGHELVQIACDRRVRNRHVALLLLPRVGSFSSADLGRIEMLAKDSNPKVRRALVRMISYGGFVNGHLTSLSKVLLADPDSTVRAAFGFECETDVLELD